jgi:hypothetical protein
MWCRMSPGSSRPLKASTSGKIETPSPPSLFHVLDYADQNRPWRSVKSAGIDPIQADRGARTCRPALITWLIPGHAARLHRYTWAKVTT